MPVRVIRWLSDVNSEYPYSKVIDGIDKASSTGAHVISMSLSLGAYDLSSCQRKLNESDPEICQSDLSAAVDAAVARGTVLVFAAGNDSGDVAFPAVLAATKAVIAVGATDQSDEIKKSKNANDWGSNHGPGISVVAPGIEIVTTDRTGATGFCSGNYVRFLGTSAATPIVAGVAALMQSQYMSQGLPLLSPIDLKKRMEQTATDLGLANRDDYYGFGRVDACKALQDGSCPKKAIPIVLPLVALAIAVSAFLWLLLRKKMGMKVIRGRER
jgi:subtilisin family serine protease